MWVEDIFRGFNAASCLNAIGLQLDTNQELAVFKTSPSDI